MTRAKKIKRHIGDVLAIKLEDGSFSFGRVLEEPLVAFYDCRSADKLSLEEVVSKPIIFKVWVMNSAVESGRWEVLGNEPLDQALQEAPRFFKQSPLNKKFSIYYQGLETPCTTEECQDLERAAVWDPEHVEDRLRDHYDGAPNQWVESLRAQ